MWHPRAVLAHVLAAFFYDPKPEFGADPKPFVFLMAFGFVMAVVGHIVRARVLVAVGIVIVFAATFALPLVTNVVKSS